MVAGAVVVVAIVVVVGAAVVAGAAVVVGAMVVEPDAAEGPPVADATVVLDDAVNPTRRADRQVEWSRALAAAMPNVALLEITDKVTIPISRRRPVRVNFRFAVGRIVSFHW